jgi:predicted N-acetyltransferase YhbS
MEFVEFGRLSDAHRAELEGDEDDPFDGARSPLAYQRKERHVAIAGDDGRLIASTGMLVVEVEVASRRFEVIGLGGVIVTAANRGRGLGREVVEAALARARTLGPVFALLFCYDDRAGLYRKLGFADVPGSVRVGQPACYVTIRDRTMWRGLQPDAQWPHGDLIVHGLPF